MTCPHCGQELSKSALFCGVCGANAPETILESNPAPIPETNPEPKSNADVDNAKINYLSPDSSTRDLSGDSSNNSSNTESTKLAIAKDEPMTRQRRPPPERDQASHERANQFIEQATRQRAYEAAVNALVGKRAAAYQKRFQSNSIFNIWGFVFGPSWYAWRRMIGKAFLSSIICAIPIIGLIAFFITRSLATNITASESTNTPKNSPGFQSTAKNGKTMSTDTAARAFGWSSCIGLAALF